MLTTTRGSAALRAQLESERAESVADASALSRVLAVASDATCAGDVMTEALVAIRDEVGPTPTVLLDSGVRSGADVYVARALGADAVLLGRSYVYGMALAGQQGIEDVITNVVAELDLTMGLTGVRDLAGITRELVQPAQSAAQSVGQSGAGA